MPILVTPVLVHHPARGSVIVPAGEAPEWAVPLITNIEAWESAPEQAEATVPRPDSRAGRDAWADYAASLGIEVAGDATKADIRAAVDTTQA